MKRNSEHTFCLDLKREENFNLTKKRRLKKNNKYLMTPFVMSPNCIFSIFLNTVNNFKKLIS